MTKKNTNKNIEQNSTINRKNVFADYIAIFFVVAYLAMDFIPYTDGVDNVGIQYLFLAVANLITGLYLFKNPQLISKEYFGAFKNSYAIKAYLLFLLLCGLSIFVSSHYSLSIISFTQLLITFCLFLNISMLLYNRTYLMNKIAFAFIVVIFLQCIFAVNNFINISKSQSLGEAFLHLQGNTGNINIFAANMATKIPFLLFGIFAFSKYKKWLSIVSLFLAALLILLTGSRASFLGLSIEAIAFIVLLLKFNSHNKVKFRIIATVIIPLVFSYFTANLIMAKSKDTLKRFQSVSGRISEITDFTESSTNKRFVLWSNAIEITKNNPMFGIGIGNWQIESIPYERLIIDDLRFSIHPHNDFLEIASETGVLNSIIFLLIFIFTIIINVRRIFFTDDNQIKLIAVITLLMTATYGIDSFFNFPLHRPTMQYNLALLLALTLVNIPKINEVNYSIFSKKVILILIIISFGTVFFSYQLQQAILFENEINIDSKLPGPDQKITSDYIKTHMPQYIEVNLNSVPFYELLGKYYYKEKQYDKAITCFNLSEKINPYSGKSDYFRYKIAQEKGLIDSAYFYTKRSLESRPRCESYFLETISSAVSKKDTSGILKIHYNFIKFRNSRKYWMNTSSALILSKYSYDNTMKFISEGLKVFPNDTLFIERRNSYEFDVLTKKALELEKNKKHINAIDIYKIILKKDSANITALRNISACFINLKNYKTAIYYLEKTLKFSNDANGKFSFYLGVCYYATNNKEKGCYYINLAVEKNYPNAVNTRDQYCN